VIFHPRYDVNPDTESIFSDRIVVFRGDDDLVKPGILGVTIFGYSEPKVMIVADRIVGCDDLAQVMAHELGHVLGLEHTSDNGLEIMSAHHHHLYGTCPRKPDAVAFCRLFGCKLEDFDYCGP
jgi:hypothetical protein